MPTTGQELMAEKSPDIQEKNIYRFLLKFVNFLVLLGYIVMYPFEWMYAQLKELPLEYKTDLVEKFSWRTDDKKPKKKKKKRGLTFKQAFLLNYRRLEKNLSDLLAQPEVQKPKKAKKSKAKKEKPKKTKPKKTKSKKKKAKSEKRRFRPAIAFVFGVVLTLLLVFVPFYVYSWYRELPQPELLEHQIPNKTTKIFDKDGRLLYEIYVDKKYDPVDLEVVPDHVVKATLAIEDSNFYEHQGFDPISMMRAAKAIVVDDELQGGSTITQQLVKNVLLTPERTISRKTRELVLAVLVEDRYSKDEILQFYLNNIPYGGTSYGVQTAAQKYFGKNVWDLDLAEASMLAGLPSAPSAYSPVQGNEELAKVRQKQVLARMVELKYVTPFEAEEAFGKDLTFVPQVEYIRAPHFVEYVRKQLYEKYGQRAVDFGGLTVTTTIDLDLQERVQEIVTDEVARSENLNISNGAAVVIDNRTGGILAYVGSIDFFSGESGNFDVVTAYRQPGSSIKPITYALAFEKGLTPVHTIKDSPITYQSYGQKYTPKNYDNKFHGVVTLRQALANSYNVPAVKLLNKIGMDDMVQLGIDLGIENWTVGDGTYGLAVTLGGKEVRLLDLSNVYATFARGGEYMEPTPFISVEDVYGFEIFGKNNGGGEQVVSPETAYLITNILSDNAARTSAFGPRSKLVIPGHTVAVKTGTTNDIRDNLTFGYTPSYTVGVWVGNNDNTPMSRVASGVSGAAPMWNSIMAMLLIDTPDEVFMVPDGIIVKTDNSCGRTAVFDKESKIPGSLCPEKDDDKDDKDNEDEKDEGGRASDVIRNNENNKDKKKKKRQA